jgi:hypothetical protein
MHVDRLVLDVVQRLVHLLVGLSYRRGRKRQWRGGRQDGRQDERRSHSYVAI